MIACVEEILAGLKARNVTGITGIYATTDGTASFGYGSCFDDPGGTVQELANLSLQFAS